MMLKFLTVAIAIVTGALADYGDSGSSRLGSSRSDGKTVKWTAGTFNWPCESTKNLFKKSGSYVSNNIMATRTAIFKDDAFIVMPRYKPGVPVTLAKLSLKNKHGCSSVLTPFPCWDLQEEGNCDVLQNVVDIFLDQQDILWALDTGVVNFLDNPIRTCSPKVMAFNVKTGKVVKTVDLSALTTPVSRLQYVIADYSADGRVFIYVTDAATRAILVYDVTSGRGYRVVLPKATTMGAGRRDVLYEMLLRRADGATCLVFSYLSGSRLFSIKTEYLQNGSTSGKIHDLGPKGKNMVFLGTDNGNAVFFRYQGEHDVYRWDAGSCFDKDNFQMVARGNECSPISQVVPDYKRNRMRIFESNFPDFFAGTVGCGVNHVLTVLENGRSC